MTYRGTVNKGRITLESPIDLPDGTRVSVRPAHARHSKKRRRASPSTLYERLAPIIGKARGLPRDFARNLDHYLYGLPKRK